MAPVLATVLIIVTAVLAVAIAIAVPFFFGMMAYDVAHSRKTEKVDVKEMSTRIAVERGVARAFVLAGGIFWTIATFAGLYSFRSTGISDAAVAAFIPAIACAATLVIGWYYERFTAALLLLASFAVVAWGVVYQWEMGVWMIMTFALIGPILTASVLLWLARTDQEAYELAQVVRPELAFVFSARSSL